MDYLLNVQKYKGMYTEEFVLNLIINGLPSKLGREVNKFYTWDEWF